MNKNVQENKQNMKLKEYLDSKGIKYDTFSDHLGICRGTLYKIFRGADIKLSVALNIVLLTKGDVTFEDLKPSDFKLSKAVKQSHS